MLLAANGGLISTSLFYSYHILVFFLTLISGTSSGKPIGEPSQGIVKDGVYSNKTSQQRKVRK